jgi:hypothetical protein
MSFAGKCIELEIIMFSEISQTQKVCHMWNLDRKNDISVKGELFKLVKLGWGGSLRKSREKGKGKKRGCWG